MLKKKSGKVYEIKRKRSFLILLAIFTFIFTTCLIQGFITLTEKPSEIASPLEKQRISDFWPSLDPIYIDDLGEYNWTWARMQDWCTIGNGSEGNPYVIENVTINGGGSDSCIEIRNSNAHFIVRNCTLFNSSSGPYAGIFLLNASNGQILNNNCSYNQGIGIYISENSNNNTIFGNNVSNNDYGIYIYDECINTIVSGNTVRNSHYCGIYSSSCLGLNMFDNMIYGGGLYVTGSGLIDYLNTHDINTSNRVDDKPFYYYVNQIGLKSDNFSNAGQIMLVNCSHSVISGESFTNTYAAIHFYSSSDNNITENHIYNHQFGIYLHQNCENNTISENNVSYNYRGIYLNSHCDNNTFTENNASYNNNGFYINGNCDNNTISENYIDNNNFYGIYSYKGSSNFLLRNTINYNSRGIYISDTCVNNSVIGNNISYNTIYGINLDDDCEYSLIYLNIFTQNGVNGMDNGTNNQWDNGSIGNLWSDYGGIDEALPYGIGDSSYDLSGTSGARDHYPLIDTTLHVSFIVNISRISEREIIQFTFTGTGGFGPVSFLWEFGDGTNSTNRNPQHQYLVQGIYTVVLEVSDYGGYQSTCEILIQVTPNDDNQDHRDQDDPTMIIVTTVVASVGVGGVATAASYSVYHAKQATTQASKIAKKKIKGKKSSKHGKNVKQLKQPIKSSKEILNKLTNKDELLKIFKDDIPLEQISGLAGKPLTTTVSNEFLTNIDTLGFSPSMKEEFLREMLSLSPSERLETLDGVLIDLETVPPILEEKKKEDVLVYEDYALELIQEYVEKHKHFDPITIVSYLNSRFSKASINVNVNGIKKVIRSLIKKNLIIEGSILTKDDILNNNNRKKIYKCVKDNPGIHFNKIIKKTKIARMVVRWHVNMLNKFQFVRLEQIGNQHAYFDNETKHQDTELMHFISREKSKNIIEYLKKNDEGCLLTELSKELGMHYNTIKKYVKKLEELDIISSKQKKYYYLNEKILAEINDS
ncbi:MAG: right-handed parallel beta-helix repeat-containing protein [Candidatus Lokiarchaeota archaeon]|nr:right-handed parallel beta-helix repeat-containing protein [Candidatus Lokiarchaeota archaeon]